MTEKFDLVFDCSGSRADTANPLVRALMRQGRAFAAPQGAGLAVAPNGSLLDRFGRESGELFALGPLGHGSLYEITAAREIVAGARSKFDAICQVMSLMVAVEPGALRMS